jgi:hypothetical protein
LLAGVLLLAAEASAERVSLLGFEGDNARALRWRVAAALKRAGHTVVGAAPPKDSDDSAKLRAFAKRRRVDVFIAGSSVQANDGWELALSFKDPEGEAVGRGVTFSGENLRGVIRELKEEGPDRLDGAVRGGGSRSGGTDAETDGAAAGDFAGKERARAKKKGARSRQVEEPVEVDEDSAAEEKAPAARPRTSGAGSDEATFDADEEAGGAEAADAEEKTTERTSEARGWANSDSEPSEDDGRASFLSEGADAESSEETVGADDGGGEDADAAGASDDPTVVLGLNAGFVRRTLGYSDDLYSRLRSPSANAWVYRLKAAVYPFAKPVKNRLGLIAGYESEFSGVVRDNDAGTDFGVTFSDLYGGVELRQPLGKHEIALEGTIGSMKAGLDDPGGASGVPEYAYTSLRAALGARLSFSRLSLSGSAGYRLPIGGYGQASEAQWFPRMEGYGLEGSLGLGYRISDEVAFEMSGSLRRFLLQMNSQPADAMGGEAEVAGGAVDLYLGGYFGLSIRL